MVVWTLIFVEMVALPPIPLIKVRLVIDPNHTVFHIVEILIWSFIFVLAYDTWLRVRSIRRIRTTGEAIDHLNHLATRIKHLKSQLTRPEDAG